jgi:hypothetical protein
MMWSDSIRPEPCSITGAERRSLTSPRKATDIGEEDASPLPAREERRLRDRATLSVVLLSSGSANELERAINVLMPTVRRFGAEVVVARACATASTTLLHEHPEVRLVHLPLGSTRTELCDAAMTLVRGDIVALREDVAVRDDAWLHSFRASLRVPMPTAEVVDDWTSVFADDANGTDIRAAKPSSTRLLAPEIPPEPSRSTRPMRTSDRSTTGERIISKEL